MYEIILRKLNRVSLLLSLLFFRINLYMMISKNNCIVPWGSGNPFGPWTQR